ncbi:hypothetical protein [Archangium sp.]|uniref:hypothetical protein n=1 Tax=Archangium sp. TaxID=1872627 RepID=UPI002D5461A3|nr:hypothetical protein [Archangium sp.]HYO58365.1 hypothetical protein [Archangium sp.]
MEKWTLGYGTLLTTLGVGGFLATGAQHKTALIPAGFGTAALGLGLLARRGTSQRWLLGGSALVGLLGFLGAARGLRKLPALLRGEKLERPVAVVSQSVMAGLSAAYTALGVRDLLRA